MIIKTVYPYNDCLVTVGKLITVKQNTKSCKEGDVIKAEKEYVISGVSSDDIENDEVHKLYIISDTEPIETGDKVFESNLSNERIYEVYLRDYKGKPTKGIFRFTNVFVPIEKTTCKKVIVFHEQFTPKCLESIILHINDLNIDEEVLVVCESSYVLDDKHLPYPHEKESEHCYIVRTIDYQNHIQLLPISVNFNTQHKIIPVTAYNPRKHRTRLICEGV